MGTPAYITVKHVHRLSPKAVRVTLDPGDNLGDWRNIPGGFMTFCLPCGDPVLTRSYSLVQGPESTYPEVIVKETGGTRGSAFVNRKFEAGLKVMAYPLRDACCRRRGQNPHPFCALRRRRGHHPAVPRDATPLGRAGPA